MNKLINCQGSSKPWVQTCYVSEQWDLLLFSKQLGSKSRRTGLLIATEEAPFRVRARGICVRTSPILLPIAMIFLNDVNKVRQGEIFATFYKGTLWANAGPQAAKTGAQLPGRKQPG